MADKFLEFLILLGVVPAMLILAGLEKLYFEKISGAVATNVSMAIGGIIFSLILFGIFLLLT